MLIEVLYIAGKTDPYVILSLGNQIIRSKKNSQTTVIGPPGAPIWNQDFHMLVANPRKQKLYIQVKDSLGFADFTVGTAEVDLGSLQDTVPMDRIVVLRGSWGLFRQRASGEILLRLTYKAYVEDEDDDKNEVESVDAYTSDDELLDIDESKATYEPRVKDSSTENDKESFMDVLAALIVSEEFQGIVAFEPGSDKILDDASSARSIASKPSGPTAELLPLESNSSEESVLFWLAVITTIVVLVAVNMGGSSFFNP
uniref:C2 domain-containing protein n=1 Tax=Rhizophora mucronata TaxID=61149 RepID=A0A2P2J0B9_RHIMU